MIYRPSIVLVSFYFLPLLFGSSSATASNTQNTQNNNILEKYDDHRWSRLPEWVREAAIVLSYTEELWDNDQEPEETEDQHWHELTSEQQDAAAALGYTAEMWNIEEDTVEVTKTQGYELLISGGVFLCMLGYAIYLREELSKLANQAMRRLSVPLLLSTSTATIPKEEQWTIQLNTYPPC